jgi:putative ABC transport system permease protein
MRSRRRRLFWPVPIAREVDEEIAAHLELQTHRYVARGMTEADARAAALERFGDINNVRDECQDIRREMEATVRRAETLEELRQDAAFAIRTMRASPLFTLVALLTMAIGIGANTAIFSVVDAVLLRSLPYRHGDRTYLLWNGNAENASTTAVAVPEYFDYRDQFRAFDAVAAITRQPSTIVGAGGEPERLMAYVVSPNLFDLLGVRRFVGRDFRVDDGSASAEKVILISHALWVRRFGGDSAVLGSKVNVAGRIRTVIGIMPSDVRFPDAPLGFLRERADLWIPSSWEQNRGDSRGNQIIAVVARARAGASAAQLRADLSTVEARFRAAFPNRYAKEGVPRWRIVTTSLHDQMVGSVRRALGVLTAAVALLLLIACVNVANLLLARGALRQREMAVRTALGAGRARLVRQLLTESTMLAAAGGALGIALAWVGVRLLTRAGDVNLPQLDQAQINGPVLAFSIAASIVAGLLVGIIPALQQSRTDIRASLGDGSRGSSEGRSRRRLRTALVTAQVAMALIILIAAGLVARSFAALQRVDPGFAAPNTVTFQLTPSRVKYDSMAKVVALYEDIQSRIANVPGAAAASFGYPVPMAGDGWSGSFDVFGEPSGPTIEPPHAEYGVAMPGYFKAMGISLIAGRDFSTADRNGAPRVVIVDEQLARRHWPNETAVGKQVNANDEPGRWSTVVGVVRHVRRAGPADDGEPQIYLPYLQNPQTTMSAVVRSNTGSVTSLVPSLRAAVRAVDAELAVAKLRTVDDLLAAAVARQRFNALMLSIFALVALTLASVGLYGVMSYLVAQRTRELGIRIALGGSPGAVRRVVVRESLLIAVTGLVVGLAVSLALSRVLRGLLFGVPSTDVVTYAGVSTLLLVVALIASYGPARRATRIDPVVALRE